MINDHDCIIDQNDICLFCEDDKMEMMIEFSAGDPDPPHFGKVDPNPHRSGKLDPDPHRSEKQDPDPHQSEKVEALEGHFGALEGPNLEKGEW